MLAIADTIKYTLFMKSKPKTVGAQVSVEEHRKIVRKAKRAGMRKSAWVRQVLMAAISRKVI